MRVPLRSLFVLGRISNLPTVWSNCLAAWLIRTGGTWQGGYSLAIVCAAVSLLYVGGMYLNDACDVTFDAVHRPERPIPSRQISRRAVILLGVLFLYVGTLTLFCLVPPSDGWHWILALPATIVLYDLLHKKTVFAPLLMAGCRVLIYPVVALAAEGVERWGHISPSRVPLIWMAACAMGGWILTLSLLARTESRAGTFRLPVLGLLFLPIVLGWYLSGWSLVLPLALLTLWIGRCVVPLIRGGPAGPVVGDLLAGIPLVDLIFAANAVFALHARFHMEIPGESYPLLYLLFLACMGMALVLRRYVPAT